MPKNEKGFYELEVVEQEFVPNRENPQRVIITCEAQINGEIEEKTLKFTPNQVADGSWEKHFMKWIEEEENGKPEVPDLRGETIENTGYDHTGPEREYPGRG